MTGHDSIGWRRHSRVRTVPPERSMERDVHEHTDFGASRRAGCPSRPSMLCARGVFFFLSVCPFSEIHGWESRSCGWVGGDAATTAEGKMDGREEYGCGNTQDAHRARRPSLSTRGIGNAELQPQCQSACRAVYNMMAGLFWRPAYVCPGRMLGSLPLLQPWFFFFALSPL